MLEPYAEANLEPKPDLVVIGNAMSRGNPEVEWLLDARGLTPNVMYGESSGKPTISGSRVADATATDG